jgi:hypothetical protein
MPLIIDGICPAERRCRDLRSGGQRNVVATSEVQQMRHVRRSASSWVGDGRNTSDLGLGPAEQHGQGTGIIGVAA